MISRSIADLRVPYGNMYIVAIGRAESKLDCEPRKDGKAD